MSINKAMGTVRNVADAEVAAADELLAESIPTGNYTAKRIKAIVDAINTFKSTVGDDNKLTFKATDIEGDELPESVARELMAISEALKAYATLEPEEAEDLKLFELGQLTDDSALALVTVSINSIAKDKTFKKFLRSEVAPSEEATSPETTEAPVEATPEGLDSSVLEDLSILEGM